MLGVRRSLYTIVPMALLAAVLVLHFRSPEVLGGLRLQVFDLYQRLHPRRYAPGITTIVDIDDQSLARVGQWPWPRTRLAELLDRIRAAGAAVVVLDFLFPEADRTSPAQILPLWPDSPEVDRIRRHIDALPNHDAIFAAAIGRGRVVTGFALVNDGGKARPPRPYDLAPISAQVASVLPRFDDAVVNLPIIDDGAAGVGSVNLVPERDGVVRRVHLMLRDREKAYPTLAAEAIRVAQHARRYELRPATDTTGLEAIKIGNLVVPTDRAGRLWIHFTPAEPSRYLPAWEVLAGKVPAGALAGQVVFVGTTAAALFDHHTTALRPAVPGVEVQASIVEQVLLGHVLMRPGWIEAAELVYLVVLALALIFLLPRLRALGSAVVGAIATALALAVSWVAFTKYGWLVDPVLPSLTVLLLYLVGTFIGFLQTEAERRHVRHAFGHYLAPAVVEQLTREPGRLVLGGERRDATFLFTDIEGFTSLTERSDPEQLVQLLNEYLDGACGIVLEHRGTIDKIVGDALHVMFNAPTEQPDHAERAVRCALALDGFCSGFAAAKAAAGIDFGKTRIGVNTGPTVVGNFGGAGRFDYTAHGDAINTAARLESVNQHLGTRVCISETTRERCDGIELRPVGRLVLKGKQQGLLAFEPASDADGSAPLDEYLAAYDCLEHESPGAAAAFLALRERYPDDPLVAFHARRLEAGARGDRVVFESK